MSDLIRRMDAVQACQVGPSGEWSRDTKSGYNQAATDCAMNILRVPAVKPDDLITALTAERDSLLSGHRILNIDGARLQDRIEALTAERDEAINQLDSAIHSQIVLEKRTAAVMEDRKLILQERDRTFALMLTRAEKAEADNARLREALTGLVSVNEQWNAEMAAIVGRPPRWADSYLNVARAALRGESHE